MRSSIVADIGLCYPTLFRFTLEHVKDIDCVVIKPVSELGCHCWSVMLEIIRKDSVNEGPSSIKYICTELERCERNHKPMYKLLKTESCDILLSRLS